MMKPMKLIDSDASFLPHVPSLPPGALRLRLSLRWSPVQAAPDQQAFHLQPFERGKLN